LGPALFPWLPYVGDSIGMAASSRAPVALVVLSGVRFMWEIPADEQFFQSIFQPMRFATHYITTLGAIVILVGLALDLWQRARTDRALEVA
jgi:hypothetical protein